ncbi:long-chain fatty alcohol dehydrogenase [Hypoxylon trugodes]|uniref:long-chain fatty alcohol dehydrogenase n=1 Tax=Hypoxylon trugodes TaxID=326681 RepID=UPI0021900CAF|nr:long-chain fatty alcohol dehydrogenase [Hypoxylon trugodes]KAI1386462.1 long-chain fatty alcohol dehydrogenase [Hypoxylon trugodes]
MLIKPVPASDTFFTETQWKVLFSLLDAVIPSVAVGGPSDMTGYSEVLRISENHFHEIYHGVQRRMRYPPTIDQFREYLAFRPVDDPRFISIVKQTVSRLSRSSKSQLGSLLNFMITRFGSLFCTWYLRPLTEQPVHIRESIMKSWHQAWFPLWHTLARSFSIMAKVGWTQSNQLLRQISNYRVPNGEADSVGPTHNFDFMHFDSAQNIVTIKTDVVIIGSGCGGGVCAKVLAEAGHRVVVVEKGYYIPPCQLPIPVDDAEYLYRSGLSTADGTMSVLAGSCWGGGGTVNWSVSLRTQDYVCQEWVDKGLGFFGTPDYQSNLDRKEPRNWAGEQRRKARSSSELAAGKAGAQFIEGLDVSEILFEDRAAKKATGVIGTWTARELDGNIHTPRGQRTQRQVCIKAEEVIVACGAINSPLLLKRSNLENPHIGKNLHMHPAGILVAAFDHDVQGWNGSIVTGVVTEFENMDGEGHGVKIEAAATLPHMTALTIPWRGALQYKLDALKLRQLNSFNAILRDRDTGSVSADPDGWPIIKYTPSAFDRKHIVQGLVAIAKLCYMQGAVELFPFVTNLPPFECLKPVEERTIEDEDFVEWLQRLNKHEMNPAGNFFGCAHQMSTCRMSSTSADGVVDDRGRVWGTKNVYVADASVLPSASGVNPMVTIMAIADHISRWLIASKQFH